MITSSPESTIERVPSGNAQIDLILGGGFPASSVNVIMGLPGTGKTILVEQLMFHNATAERPALYLTTLSEPLPKVIRYLQNFSFFDESKLGEAILYEDIGERLAADGVEALLARVREALLDRPPSILVIDSFKVLHDLEPSQRLLRRLTHELAALLSACDTTAFLLGEYTDAHIATMAEFSVADSIVQLSRNASTRRDERFLRVHKLRGSAYREGVHSFRIGGGGLEVFPRLVSPRLPEGYQATVERLSFGTPGLDELIGGGVERGSSTVLMGPSGSGKTSLALAFALEGVRRGEHSLYVNFQEDPTQLRRRIASLDRNVSPHDERLQLLYRSPVELMIDSILVDIFALIQQGKVQRLVIDSMGDLAKAVGDTQRLHDYTYALIQHLRVHGVTCLLLAERGSLTSDALDANDIQISYLADNLLTLETRGEERRRRFLRVAKVRGSAHELDPYELVMKADGIFLR